MNAHKLICQKDSNRTGSSLFYSLSFPEDCHNLLYTDDIKLYPKSRKRRNTNEKAQRDITTTADHNAAGTLTAIYTISFTSFLK